VFGIAEVTKLFEGCIRGALIVFVLTIGIVALAGYAAGIKSSKGGNSMVKVSSDGPVLTKKVVCSKCAYELEYTGEDVKDVQGFIMGESDTSYYIVCPRKSCKKHVTVKAWW